MGESFLCLGLYAAFNGFTRYTFPYLVCLRVTPAASSTCANVAGLLPRMAAGLYIFSLLNMSEAESRSLPSSSSPAGSRHERLLPPDKDDKRRCCGVAISLEKRYFFLNGRYLLLITLFTIIYRIFALDLSMIH